MYDLIVIGGGPAALAATAYALDKQLKVLMIYKSLGGKAGQYLKLHAEEGGGVDYLVGQILVHLNFAEEGEGGDAQQAGEGAVQLFKQQLKNRAEVLVRDEVVAVVFNDDSFEVTTLNNGTQRSTAVIVATGVAAQPLDVRGAREFVGHGLGYSATTYASRLTQKRVAVIGATSRAMRGAAELARSAAQVYLIPLSPVDPGGMLFEALCTMPNVEVLDNYRVVEFQGGLTVEQLIVEHHQTQRAIAIDAAFVDLGLAPNSALVSDLVATDSQGFIYVDAHSATATPGLFAAGDVTTMIGEQVLIAIGDGARAALNAYDYILAHPLMQQMSGKD